MSQKASVGEDFIAVAGGVTDRVIGVSSSASRGVGKAELIDEGMVDDVGA